MSFEREGIDTLKLARKFLPDLESRALENLCVHFHIPHTAHRALGDAEATQQLYVKLCELFWNEKDFAPRQLVYKVKKEGPASGAQKERLYRLAGTGCGYRKNDQERSQPYHRQNPGAIREINGTCGKTLKNSGLNGIFCGLFPLIFACKNRSFHI